MGSMQEKIKEIKKEKERQKSKADKKSDKKERDRIDRKENKKKERNVSKKARRFVRNLAISKVVDLADTPKAWSAVRNSSKWFGSNRISENQVKDCLRKSQKLVPSHFYERSQAWKQNRDQNIALKRSCTSRVWQDYSSNIQIKLTSTTANLVSNQTSISKPQASVMYDIKANKILKRTKMSVSRLSKKSANKQPKSDFKAGLKAKFILSKYAK